jgi:uncharacterized protein YbjT (DUF2867 family)
MRVAVMGASGSVGEHVLKALKEKGHESVAVISEVNRKPDMEKLGATEVIISDGEKLDEAFSACDSVIYISGSSQKTGENKTVLIDHSEVIDSIKEAKSQGINRFVLVSAIRANEPENSDSRKIGAKHQPDELLRQEGFNYTIVRPSHMVDKPGNGLIQAGESLDNEGEIPREDVASVLAEVLENEATYHKTYEITAGKTPIRDAF